MTDQTPFFLSTSFGPIAAVATTPTEPRSARGVVFLTGGRSHISRPLFGAMAWELAETGVPVLQFDYPSKGLSDDVDGLPPEFRSTVAREAAEWFAGEGGIRELVLVGHCAGGLVGLDLLELDQVVHIVAFACPLRQHARTKRTSKRVRVKLAAIEGIGALVTKSLSKGVPSAATAEGEWFPAIVPGLQSLRPGVLVEFVCGEHDEFSPDLADLELQGRLNPDAVRVTMLPGTKMRGFPKVEDHERIKRIVFEAAAPDQVPATGAVS